MVPDAEALRKPPRVLRLDRVPLAVGEGDSGDCVGAEPAHGKRKAERGVLPARQHHHRLHRGILSFTFSHSGRIIPIFLPYREVEVRVGVGLVREGEVPPLLRERR